MSGDVIVIGGGISGLVAATYLARAGKHVTLLEAHDRLGGVGAMTRFGEGFSAPLGAQTLYAVDPRVTADLKLARHGLKFALRDMPLVGLDGNGKHIVLQRDVHVTTTNIAVHSAKDARAWPHFRRELLDLARALRPLWQGEDNPPKGDMRGRIDRLSKMGAVAWLDSWFESDTLKATLCFDSTGGGLSPIEAGSALTLAWRAAQEMSGLQGAVAMATGDTLVESLLAAAQAAGVAIQTDARVVALLSDGESVTGVRLANGETQTAQNVFSSLSRSEVLQTMMPPLAGGIAQAARYASCRASTGQTRILLALCARSHFGGIAVPDGARLILLENPDALTIADLAAGAGHLANDVPAEVVIPTLSDASVAPNGQHLVSMLMRPVPRNPIGGWQTLKPKLVERAVQALERHAPGTAATIVAVKVFTPDNQGDLAYQAPANVEHLLAPYKTRIKSPLRGLLFCGADAEPVPAISGRAARLAATMLTGRK
jgi:phytoene dehydrogenase-like protein